MPYVDKDTGEEYVSCSGCGKWIKKVKAYATEALNFYLCSPICDTDDSVPPKPLPDNLKLITEAEPVHGFT